MIRIVLLGSGKIAKHLYAAFSAQPEITIVQCYNRKGTKLSHDQADESVTRDYTSLKEADIYVMAVSDDAIEEVSSHLLFNDRLVVHTSGSVPMQTIHSKHNRGVFYPLQTFSKTTSVDFKTIPVCIEAENNEDLILLKKLGSLLTNKVHVISSEQRNVLHVAAVFANNFTNHLFTIANEICCDNDIPFEILHPLIQETITKIIKISPKSAQTGPAIRNDVSTLKRHQQLLTDTTQREIYQTITKAIQSTYGKKL